MLFLNGGFYSEEKLNPVFVFIIFAVLLGAIGRGRPNFVFVFGPKNADVFSALFYFRPKNPRKTAVNAMNWRTNGMLKFEYFANVRGFR